MEKIEIKNKIRIEKLDHQGRGIVRTEDGLIFVVNALDEEIVDIEITKRRSKFMEANMTHLWKKSEDRVEPICPYDKICGGCDIMHFSYAKQLAFKQKKVVEIMDKFGHLTVCPEIIPSMDPLGYRNKVVFQVNKDLGFYQKNSNCLVAVDQCYLIPNEMNVLFKEIKKYLPFSSLTKIMMRKSWTTGEMMIVFYGVKGLPAELLEFLKGKVSSLIFDQGKERTVYGNETITEELEGLTYLISPDSFFQVNTSQMITLYNKVREFADLNKKDNVLDLYCGTGTIGLFLSSSCNQVFGIEINKEAVQDALMNKSNNHINNISFQCLELGKGNMEIPFVPDVVIVDPPRSGLDKKTILWLLENEPRKIVYVSCDPITLARDISSLSSYQMTKMCLVDMFPNTEHVECVCLLVHKTIEK